MRIVYKSKKYVRIITVMRQFDAAFFDKYSIKNFINLFDRFIKRKKYSW